VETPFVESIEVRVVNVDVVVTDRTGAPMDGLTREDFELYEDGNRVDVEYFSKSSAGEFVDAAVSEPREVRSAVTWALFVDQTNVKFGRRNQALRELRTFLERGMAAGDRAILTTYDGFTFRARGSITEDRAVLLRTLEQLEKERVQLGRLAVRETMIRGEIEQVVDPYDEAAPIARSIFTLIEEEANRTQGAIRAMGSLLDVLDGFEGRIAVVYVGAGFNMLPAINITEAWRRRFPDLVMTPQAPRPENRRVELTRDANRLYDRLSAARATVYTIHAGDPGGAPISPEDSGTQETTGSMGGDGQLTEIGSARGMAERTGGRFFTTNPGLHRQLERVRTDLDHSYSLGYKPSGAPGQSRAIRVRVKVDGARVRYREAVRERSTDEQAADATVAALFDPRESNPLGVTIETSPVKQRKMPVRVSVPLDALTFLPQADVHHAGVIFHFALSASDGSIWRLGSRELPLAIAQKDLARALREKVSYSVDVPMQGRGLRLAVSVQDRIGQTRSIVIVALD
jgi:VWFA-related protein